MLISVRAFSSSTISIPGGVLYPVNLFSGMLTSWAKTNDECSKPFEYKLALSGGLTCFSEVLVEEEVDLFRCYL